MAQSLGIQDFIQHLKDNGIQRSNRFVANLTSYPQFMLDSFEGTGITEFTKRLSFSTQTVIAPGYNISTMDRINNGNPIKIPYDREYGECSITFYCSADNFERIFFVAWLNNTVLPNKMVEYYDNIIGNIDISFTDALNNMRYGVQIQEVYPTVVTPITMDMTSGESIATFQVTFAFKRMRESMLDDSGMVDDSSITQKMVQLKQQADTNAANLKHIKPKFKDANTERPFSPSDMFHILSEAQAAQNLASLIQQIKDTHDVNQAIMLAKLGLNNLERAGFNLDPIEQSAAAAYLNNVIFTLQRFKL